MIIDPHNSAASEYIAEFSRPGDKVKILPVPFKRPTTEELKNQTTKSVFDLNTMDPDSYVNHSVYCTASILRFPTYGGWWYKGCPSCSKVLKVKEDSGEFFCPKHDAQMPLPCYKVYVTIHDDHNQATVILMGKQGQQLFGISCQDLVNKRLYPTEQTLPEEIKKIFGQTYLFQIQINQYGELVVENVFPSQQSSASMVEQNPSTATPERLSSEKKRGIETSGKTLFITETEKKAKSDKEIKQGETVSPSSASSSASKELSQQEKAN
ncbi:uncharacterized protein LOC133718359 [Rosa rugosa]|uniref:uncharacterized protein LOC133718359 n=1 Tax=Rosa rugosa TaxID=74645 RepID=UPI002B405B65|nr:uncharacterized protein LOC133718359 [Rosa rugosa]XP_062001174.1 uncharacterized protein LOC133718359 [Rosa rugosa]XP_062001175.1 uncharacterized protein LOC133718359 [Rosa rugosa]